VQFKTVIIRLVRNCALERMIQYAVTVVVALEGRGILDAPPEPVIGRAFARPVGGA
jgi:hypothetical protein